MKARNPRLYRNLKQFTEKAINLMHVATPNPQDIPTRVAYKLEGRKQDAWSLKPVDKPLWWSVVQQQLSAIRQLPIYAKCMQVLQSDPIIAPHLDRVVGTDGASATIVRADQIIPNFLSSLLSDSESLTISQDLFDTLYERMEQFFYSPQLDFRIVAPLINVTGPDEPIQITHDVNIVPNPIPRLEQWINAAREGILPIPWDKVPELNYSLECRLVGLKVVYDRPPSRPDDMQVQTAESSYNTALGRAKRAVRALRLLKPHYIAVPFFEYEMLAWHPQPSLGWQAPLPAPLWHALGPRYEIIEDDAPEIASLYQALGAERKRAHHFIDRAVHRLDRSVEELEPGERLVDLVIALESLLLHDTGEPEYRGEKSFQFALRGAYFLADDFKQRRKLYWELKKAYWLRNKIVHGGSTPANISILSETITVKSFVTRIENYVREATKRLLLLATRPDAPKQLVSWDDLILGFPPSAP